MSLSDLFSPSLLSSLFHPAVSHFNIAHDSPISLFQLVAIYDTAFNFFWRRHVVFEASSQHDCLGHSCGSMPACSPWGSLVVSCLFVPMCEAKQRNYSIGHYSYFVGMLGVSKLIKSHILTCRVIKMDHSRLWGDGISIVCPGGINTQTVLLSCNSLIYLRLVIVGLPVLER